MAVTFKAHDIPEPRLLIADVDNVLDLTVYVDGVATDPDAGTMSLTLTEDQSTLGTFTPATSSGKMTATVTIASMANENLFDRLGLAWSVEIDGVEYRHPEQDVYLVDVRAAPQLHHEDLTEEQAILADDNNLPDGKSNWQFVITREWIRVLERLAQLPLSYTHAALRNTWRLNAFLIPQCLYKIFMSQSAYNPEWLAIAKDYKKDADREWRDLQVYLRTPGTTAFPLDEGGFTTSARRNQRMASTALDGGI